MARSMTGFGTAGRTSGRYGVEVEVRSLNNRYLKIRTRTPGMISAMEPELEAIIRRRLSRGAVDVWIKITDIEPAEGYRIDMDLVRRYHDFAERLARELDVGGALGVADYLNLPGVVADRSDEAEVEEDLKALLSSELERALDQVEKMRIQEGMALSEDIARRGRLLGDIAGKISRRAGPVVETYRDRLVSRVNDLLSGANIEIAEENILREVSIFAERSDISEEIARIDSHLVQLLEMLEGEGDVGRKLEFVAQELQREINTIGSKASDAEISRLVVDAKGEIDRIREQAQNLE